MYGLVNELSYEIVDVFTTTPFAGNPLAVVFGADELSGVQMQTLAREFNLSETVFVLPAIDPAATYRVRIFTPEGELPFAGHPSVGAAVTQLRRGLVSAGVVKQECAAGILPIAVGADGCAVLTGGTPVLGEDLDPQPLLAAVGLNLGDHVGPAVREASCGMGFPFVRVRDDAVARAQLIKPKDFNHIAIFSWDEDTKTAHSRVFAPGVGVGEDPATGSAALAFGVWLVGAGLAVDDGTFTYTIRQGEEIRRPSILRGSVTVSDGSVVSTTVEGHVVPIARGTIAVPGVRQGKDLL